jgi:hypothetical protein
MSAWRHHAHRQGKAMVKVPLAATYLAVRLLQEAPEGKVLLSDLLKDMRRVLGSCPSTDNSVVRTVEAARRAAIPLDRDELDCLFAAGALADGSIKNRSFRCKESLLGLGYLDLERATYVATLADRDYRYTTPAHEFLRPGGFEQLQPLLAGTQKPKCGLVTHEGSPTLLALDFSAEWLKGVRDGLEQAVTAADGLKIDCRLYARGGPSRSEKNFKLHSTVNLALQPLASGIYALAQASPEWLMAMHACSMQEAWVSLECSAFRMVCRVPDISAPSELVLAAGFSPHYWFLQCLGIPETCCAYIPHKLIEPLTQRYWWFAAVDPVIWLVHTGALKSELKTAEGMSRP